MDGSNVTRVLTEARTLLQAGWTQNFFAVDENGSDLLVDHTTGKNCACYCLSGAIDRATMIVAPDDVKYRRRIEYDAERLVNDAINEIHSRQSTHLGAYISWNDEKGRTQEEVLDVVDRAIKLSESQNA